MKYKATFILLLLPFTILSAQEDTIVADRPGISTGTYTVQKGRLNIELGYQDATTQTLPLMNLRTGLSSNIELDILWDGLNIDNSTSSTSDMSIGGKYRLHKSSQYNITILGLLSLPTGSSPSTSGNYDPTLGLLWDYTVNDSSSLFGVIQTDSYKDDFDKRVYDIQAAVGISYNFTTKVGTFIELYSTTPSQSYIDEELGVDSGITYLLTNNIQLDINGGLGLNSTSEDFAGFGIAWRI